MAITKAIVPIAGMGTRLFPTTKVLPKETLHVGRLPILYRVVEELISAGINQILFVTNRSKNIIENHFDDYSELKMHVKQEQDPRITESSFDFGNAGIHFFQFANRSQKAIVNRMVLEEQYSPLKAS